MDIPENQWDRSTAHLRDLDAVPAAQANAWLLDQAREKWRSVVMARTSMYSLWFTMPGDVFPFDRTVKVSWLDDVYEFRFEDEVRLRERRLEPLVAADRSFAANAPVVLDSFLYQLAGEFGPDLTLK